MWLGFSMFASSRQVGSTLNHRSHNHRRCLHRNFCQMIGKLGLQRLGICGFTNVQTNAAFLVSAAIGSLSHVFVDWLHHPANPIFWPFLIDGSYYVDGLLLSRPAVLHASIIVATIAGAIMTAVIARALHKSGYSFSLVISNPTKALSLITESLVKAN